MKLSNSKLEFTLLLFIPMLGEIILYVAHYSFKNDAFIRLFPIITSILMLAYLAWQHRYYWYKNLFKKDYFSLINLFFAISYGVVIVYFLSSIDLQRWFLNMTYRTSVFYFLPFILSAYVVPFLLFSHVLADSLDSIKRFRFIGSAHFIMALCFAFWWIRQTF